MLIYSNLFWKSIDIELVSQLLLLNAKCVFFQLYFGENKFLFMKWWWRPLCTRPTHCHWDLECYSSTAHWHNNTIWHILLTPNQSVVNLPHQYCMLNGETPNITFVVLVLDLTEDQTKLTIVCCRVESTFNQYTTEAI
jgi:hypothetical protein